VLKWARGEKDCPWDETTCSGAAYGGHLEALKWARANHCPWDARECKNIAGDHEEMRAWVLAHFDDNEEKEDPEEEEEEEEDD
jgi:hypothetical protein